MLEIGTPKYLSLVVCCMCTYDFQITDMITLMRGTGTVATMKVTETTAGGTVSPQETWKGRVDLEVVNTETAKEIDTTVTETTTHTGIGTTTETRTDPVVAAGGRGSRKTGRLETEIGDTVRTVRIGMKEYS